MLQLWWGFIRPSSTTMPTLVTTSCSNLAQPCTRLPCDAGELARDLAEFDEVEGYFTRAADYYAEEGRLVAAAEAAARGARALEDKRPAVCVGGPQGRCRRLARGAMPRVRC